MYQVSEKSEVGCHFSCWTFMEWPSCQCIVTEMGLYSRTSALVYLGGDSCTSKSDTPSNLWSNKPYPVSGYIPSLSFVSLSNGLCNNRLVDCCNKLASFPGYAQSEIVRYHTMHLMGLLPSSTSPLVFCQTHCLYGVIRIQGFSLQWSRKRRETRRHFREYRQVFVQTAYSPQKLQIHSLTD